MRRPLRSQAGGAADAHRRTAWNQSPGVWLLRSGTQVQYLHIDNPIDNGEHSNIIKNSGETVTEKVGTNGNCGTTPVHLHQSGNTGSNVVWARNDDSCWGVAGDCPGTWKADNDLPTESTCDPEVEGWDGYETVSGNNTKYACQEWSLLTNAPAQSSPIFKLQW